jgi:hypothetical protein
MKQNAHQNQTSAKGQMLAFGPALLQRKCSCGNHTTSGGDCAECSKQKKLQKKLRIGAVNDPLEHEADRVADQVLRMPLDVKTTNAPIKLQRLSHTGSDHEGSVPGSVHQTLSSSGRPLDAKLQQDMSDRFGHDFSNVRVHQGGQAEQSARDINAKAYTVGNNVIFGAGEYAPASPSGRHLIAHELAHVVQQNALCKVNNLDFQQGARTNSLQRKVIVNKKELSPKERQSFIAANKWTEPLRALAIVEDMGAATDVFDFEDDSELKNEIEKRVSTVSHLLQSQESTALKSGGKISAFGYPFSGESELYGPRVNFAAQNYWEPSVVDNYAVRTDKAKNKNLRNSPRHERCKIYGDQCGGYGWKLSPKGQAEPYKAIANLFKPQAAHKRTLIHCDYLISVVNIMSLADSIGEAAFNTRVASFGPGNFFLKWNAFSDLNVNTLLTDSSGTRVKSSSGNLIGKKGLASTQRTSPTTEADLVIGDHVVFFNHLAYDLINQRIGNAWRLENAVLVTKSKGNDIFLGHGSGRKTVAEMKGKLAEEFNDVAKIALKLVASTKSKDKKTRDDANSELSVRFPTIVEVGGEWKISGKAGLCSTAIVSDKLKLIKSDEVIGLKDPCNLSKLNPVERPIESASGRAPTP